MKKIVFLFLCAPVYLFAQQLDSLSVEKIMRDPEWIGTSPSNVFWRPDSQKIYFQWNPEQADSDSLYAISSEEKSPKKVKPQERLKAEAQRSGTWNADHTKKLYVKGHTLYLWDGTENTERKLIQTVAPPRSPEFGKDDAFVVYQQERNLFKIDLETGELNQITNFKEGSEEDKEKHTTEQEEFLEENALKNSRILRKRKAKKEKAAKHEIKPKDKPKTIYLGDKNLSYAALSPEGTYVVYQLSDEPDVKQTMVPDFVTQSGYTKGLPTRPTVGGEQPDYSGFIYNIKQDTVYELALDEVEGIRDIPAFYDDYPDKKEELEEDPPRRSVSTSKPIWNDEGSQALVVLRSLDNKDRWIMQLEAETGKLDLLDRQHDDAWVGGPGIGYPFQAGNVGWIDEQTAWFQSEESGYSHLYTVNMESKKKKALTKGNYEVQHADLSPDRNTFYITANKEHPGEPHFYQLDIASGNQKQITTNEGGHEVSVSPDGKHIANIFSESNHPAELYVQENIAGAQTEQITDKAETEEFQSYNWRKPEIITFKNDDGLEVYAEVYKPQKQASSKPGAIFVHGAGYLQDVKKSWSDSYFREHMFMNLLADKGYTVMNIDYRGSAGYGRDWRTAIYRHMGKNDLADIVDGAKYMSKELDVNPDKIGLWGGSYGGFMTLMAMFKTDVFAAGGALRSVTDWAHYNHAYTANILNLPQNDSLAYERSSPINFAEDFDHGHLLMAHGMVDTNVHFQDIVRLSQKFIELGKDNWELAVYPVEDHAFIEPSSWTDEYKRILKLFEERLK